MMQRSIAVKERMMMLELAIVKAKKIVEGYPETKFSAEEYMRFYECVYSLSVFTPGLDVWLCEKFKNSLEESIISTVLPSLQKKSDTALLRELVQMWSNYKKMSRLLSGFFEYLDRYFIPRRNGYVSLASISVQCFQDLVFNQMYSKIQAAAILLINQERNGEHDGRTLIKDVVEAFMEIDEHRKTTYYKDFECAMLADTSAYYSRLASEWLLSDSLADYTLKVQWCMNQEKERAARCLHSISEDKLLVVVRCELLDNRTLLLIQKQKAESCGLVTDYQEMLSKCCGMSLEDGSSVAEWLSD